MKNLIHKKRRTYYSFHRHQGSERRELLNGGETNKLKPLNVWKEHFIEDRCISQNLLIKELFIAAIPHVLLNILLVSYLLFGAFLFRSIDSTLSRHSLSDLVLFSFTTITTIGYGDKSPGDVRGQMVCLVYCVIGIPLILLVLSNDGQFLIELYEIWRKWRKPNEPSSSSLPLPVTLLLLLLHSLLGGLIFCYWIDDMPFISAVYFSFISIATIGFGDIIPTPTGALQVVVVVLYMSIGIIILSTLLSALSSYLKWIHSISRATAGSKYIEVWFGGDVMTIEELVVVISKQFGVSTSKLQYLLKDLDSVLAMACQELAAAETVRIVENVKGMTNVPSSPSLDDETQKALHALGVIHHKLKKQGSLKKINSSRSLSSPPVRSPSTPSTSSNTTYNNTITSNNTN